MRFDILTIFPHIFDSYLSESIIKRARAKKLVDIRVHDLRKFSRDKSRSRSDRGSPDFSSNQIDNEIENSRQRRDSTYWSGHKKVDDRPYGGGPGMVLKIEPLARALGSILKSKVKSRKSKVKIVLFSAAGNQFDAKMARDFAKKYNRIIMIAGHYEGVDERIRKVIQASGFMLQEVSVGPYVLTGGELPAMVVVDAVSRHIPGVLGKAESLEEKRHGVGVPVYTRPEAFQFRGKSYTIPKVLLTGNHKKIEEWRRKSVRHHKAV